MSTSVGVLRARVFLAAAFFGVGAAAIGTASVTTTGEAAANASAGSSGSKLCSIALNMNMAAGISSLVLRTTASAQTMAAAVMANGFIIRNSEG